MSVRRIARWAVAAVALATTIAAGGAAWLYAAADVSTVGTLAFDNLLRIPDLAQPTVEADGTKVFDLDVGVGATELVDGVESETWGVNGPHLGPTIRVRRDDRVQMRVTNRLAETTTMHWHGMHLPAHADGGPHQPIRPGTTWTPTWQIDQPAATLWYHPHPHGATERHVYRGVAGLLIIDDGNPTGLPDDYGVDDIPLIVQDVRLDNGRLSENDPLVAPIGRLGDHILVNGTHDPHVAITAEHTRLRLLNASTARTYRFVFDDERSFQLVGTDGGLVAAPTTLDSLHLSPGERAEIVVRMEPDDTAVLQSRQPDLGVNRWDARFTGADDALDILQLRAAPTLTPNEAPRSPLAAEPITYPDIDTARARPFVLSGIEINGRRMDMGRIDHTVDLDTTEIWEISNPTGTPHNFHVHDTRFVVLDVDGSPPPSLWRGWKDTIYVRPGTTVRLAVRFSDYADPTTPYMFHCHLLRHEDQGLMGQFVVVEPER